METFILDFWQTVLMMAPWLFIGAVCIGVLYLFLPANFYESVLRGRGGVWRAVLFGVPLPLCSCAVIPVAVGMKRGGAPSSATAAFLLSTPQTGVDSIVVTGGFLGWPFAVYRVVVAALMGLAAGGMTLMAEAEDVTPEAPQSSDVESRTVRDAVEHAWTSLMAIWGWVLIGVLVSALLTQLEPITSIADYSGSTWVGCGVALLVAVPLYVCATASIPVAAALVGLGLPVEAALVFLIAGPATNVATIGAVHACLGRRVMMVYLLVTVVGSLLFAWLFALLLPEYTIESFEEMSHGMGIWEQVCGVLFVVVSLAWARMKFGGGHHAVSESVDTETERLVVNGMTCQGCVKRLQANLDENEQTVGVTVELSPSQVYWTGDKDRTLIRSIIEKSGFSTPDKEV